MSTSTCRPAHSRCARAKAEALDAADRIAVLNKGRVEQVGSPADNYDVRASVARVTTLGFEVWVELVATDCRGPFTAQITRGDAEALALREGDTGYVRATRIPPIPGQPANSGQAGQGEAN